MKTKKYKILKLIYDYLDEQKKFCSVNDIWKNIEPKILEQEKDISKKNLLNLKAEIYFDLVMDKNFFSKGNSLWCLRKFVKYEEIVPRVDAETIHQKDDVNSADSKIKVINDSEDESENN